MRSRWQLTLGLVCLQSHSSNGSDSGAAGSDSDAGPSDGWPVSAARMSQRRSDSKLLLCIFVVLLRRELRACMRYQAVHGVDSFVRKCLVRD
eukprot:SAG31_NODE_66_length_28567_cov_30.222698_4_plen_92_part_00